MNAALFDLIFFKKVIFSDPESLNGELFSASLVYRLQFAVPIRFHVKTLS